MVDEARKDKGGGRSREEKLAQALRANLRRRKAAGPKPAPKPPPADSEDEGG